MGLLCGSKLCPTSRAGPPAAVVTFHRSLELFTKHRASDGKTGLAFIFIYVFIYYFWVSFLTKPKTISDFFKMLSESF